MARQVLMERVAGLGSFGQVKAAGKASPFAPLELAHVYVKLDMKPQFENAGTADDARGFLRSVARAAKAAHAVAERSGGFLLEVQGSMLHVGLPRGVHASQAAEAERITSFVNGLHAVYREVFSNSRLRVDGWRMTVDVGKTLVVAGRGVHGDDSWVSLGKSANRPAKYLYEQLEIAESARQLKRFHVAIRDPDSGSWLHRDLDQSPAKTEDLTSIALETRQAEPKLDFVDPSSGRNQKFARAAPIGGPGTPSAPSADAPHTFYGWVMRADLDGFTARVEECFDNDQRLQALADEFSRIMEAAARFAGDHQAESLAQLPWAGDNFTAAAVFASRDAFESAASKRIVELSLDFEKEMLEAAAGGGFGGWAHGVAGGQLDGNSGGNIYLAGVEVHGRRFLVGAGEGFGRSAQAFGDTNPKAGQIVLYKPDWDRLAAAYRGAFKPAVTGQRQESTLYRVADVGALVTVRAEQASFGAATTVSLPGGRTREIPTRPYWR